MPQNADNVLDHFDLFRQPEYREMLANKKKNFENPVAEAELQRVVEWTKTWDYREKNFAREALTVNPAKACQPLGAVFAAVGFEGTIPFVHGSQGCVAYYRSHFSRHFKEPSSCVSSSMTEDAAVFGGLNNMIDGLANTYNLYKPKMISVSTTCMAEVIGDDLNAFIKTAKDKGSVPMEFDVPFAHTPAFVGSHITGYDNVMKGVFEHFWGGKAGTVDKLVREPNDQINFITGFDPYTVGNVRELKRMFDLIGFNYKIVCDNSDVWDTPTDGTFRMFDGGTTIEDTEKAVNAKATVSMQEYCTEKTLKYIREEWTHETVALNHPIGVKGTDEFLLEAFRADRQADPGATQARAWPSRRCDLRTPTRISTARSSRSTPIRTCALASFSSSSSSAPSRPMFSPPTAARSGPRRSRRFWRAARSARTAMSIPAAICGTCVRCSSRSRWISSSETPTASISSATPAPR